MDPPVALHVRYGLVQLATFPTTEAPLINMHLLVLFQQVGFGEFLATFLTLKRFVI